MRKYEVMYIVDPTDEEGIEDVKKKIEGLITGREGIIASFEKMGKKRLAYPVDGRQYGTYYLINFTGDGSIIQSLDYFMRLNPIVIRHIVLAFSEKEVQLKQATERIQLEEAERMRRGGKPMGAFDGDEDSDLLLHTNIVPSVWDTDVDDKETPFVPKKDKELTPESDEDGDDAVSEIQDDEKEKQAE